MALQQVPTEILAHIAVFLACHDPFSPPRHLLTLQSTSKFYRHALNCHLNPVVWATAFRFRFDHRAVIRRNFSPTGRDYYDQLRQYTTTLVAIRQQDYEFDEDILRTVYIMLLDNDGKNRAQLEHAGLDAYLATCLRTRLWLRAETNDGWPIDSSTTYCLWSLWMVTTPEKLQAESMPDREAIVTLILPFVLNPYRYHQAEAPPSHFLLPVPDHISSSSSLPYPHGPYPIYSKCTDCIPYFGSMQTFSQPPIATAAKLLYFARRETIPFNIPHGIPATQAQAPPTPHPAPTLEDFVEINSHKGAQPLPSITWDWDTACPLVDGIPDDQLGYDYSVKWDPDYWRRRLCVGVSEPDPKWRPGCVYVPGCMDGLWQGRLIFPPENSLRQLMARAQFPDDGSFTETDLHLTHQPIFMRLKEHHAISTSSAPVHIPFSSHPHHHPHATQTTNDDLSEWTDLSMRNAWLPGAPGTVSFITPHTRRPYPSNANTEEESPVLIALYDQLPSQTQPLPQPNQRSVWLYKTYSRQLDAERRKRAGLSQTSQSSYLPHPGSEECETCREREEAIKRARALDQADHDTIAAVYHNDWEMLDEIENMFSSVGLGRDDTEDLSDDVMDEGEEEEGEEYSGDETEEAEEAELEFLPDANAEVSFSNASDMRPVRRSTDRAKIRPCDGIQDIIFSGTTDRRHSLAWNEFTFYGRVRPWDGLIGILRRSYWPRQNFIFFYGYLVGGETFVGNWRFAAIDPNVPTWESAFVMSRRKDDDLGSQSTMSSQAGGAGGQMNV